mmetsp:Transcript_34725/g.87308  ORF Transcript_34725/g.87308 Transcript_34725/m.87308 type:complete len:411 (+) Transcript_34725:347-1579(+)
MKLRKRLEAQRQKEKKKQKSKRKGKLPASDSNPLNISHDGDPLLLNLEQFGLLSAPYIVVHPQGKPGILEEFKPGVVILYEPTVTQIRKVEVYKAMRPGKPLRVYFLMYEGSVEEQRYLSSLEKETVAFQQLIDAKAHVVLKHEDLEMTDAERDSLGAVADVETLFTGNPFARNRTRTKGNRKHVAQKAHGTVLVDAREFRSPLAFVLHQRGFEVTPITLEVGDYILTPTTCIERKSISDLFQSFKSGRLFEQVKQMQRLYEHPILLIEFPLGADFSLQAASEIPAAITGGNIISKITLLTLHFPSLRILWSKTPHETAELFREIKKNQPEPDPKRIAAIGTGTETLLTREVSSVDVLRKLPGITDHNWMAVRNRVSSLYELSTLSQEELVLLLGPVSGKELFLFLQKRR